MGLTNVSAALGLLWLASVAACAQERKPGAYELTVTTTVVSPSARVLPARTRQVCLTQEMVDKYGAILPDNLTNICQLANLVKKPGGMTTDVVCSGALNGNGTLVVNWTDSEHAKGTIQFKGTMHPGADEIKIEWSATTLSTYKGPDCGVQKTPSPPATP
jgi:hypothetical protein